MTSSLTLSPFQSAKIVREILHHIFLFLPPYALGEGLVLIVINQIKADVFLLFDEDVYVNPLKWEVIGVNLTILAFETIFFFVLNLALEYRWLSFHRR